MNAGVKASLVEVELVLDDERSRRPPHPPKSMNIIEASHISLEVIESIFTKIAKEGGENKGKTN